MPRPVYERYILGYTRRQWGVAPESLEPALARRIRINEPHQETLTPQHRHQGLPEQGYAAFMQAMLMGIDLRLETDFLASRHHYRVRKQLIFTGPIDEFFGFEHGPLQYRGQRRVHHTLSHTTLAQPCVQVNYAGAGASDPILTIEWNHLLPPAEQPLITESLITGKYRYVDMDQAIGRALRLADLLLKEPGTSSSGAPP